MTREELVLETRGRRFLLGSKTWLMGIVNVTPDSFSDGGLYLEKDKAIDRCLELIDEGADIIDIGGESTRPGSLAITAEEELYRIMPVIERLRTKSDILISVDTTKSRVARAVLEAGADIINDISAFSFDPKMKEVIASYKSGVIIMHMKGTPQTMQHRPQYDDVVAEVKMFLTQKIEEARAGGIPEECVVIDPGIGFGKNLSHNLALLRAQPEFLKLQRPLLMGFSRKSFIGQILNLPPEERLEGTIAASVLSVYCGVHMLRVHDVKAVGRAVRVAEAIIKDRLVASSDNKNISHCGRANVN